MSDWAFFAVYAVADFLIGGITGFIAARRGRFSFHALFIAWGAVSFLVFICILLYGFFIEGLISGFYAAMFMSPITAILSSGAVIACALGQLLFLWLWRRGRGRGVQ